MRYTLGQEWLSHNAIIVLNININFVCHVTIKVCFLLIHRATMNKGLLLVLALVSLLLVVPLTSASSHLTATATFNQSGVCGTITFSQEGPNDPTIIDVRLTGTECSLRLTHTFRHWMHVHNVQQVVSICNKVH